MMFTKTFFKWLVKRRIEIDKCIHCHNYKHGRVFDEEKCRKCSKKKPGNWKQGKREPGDWDCPKCGVWNFKRRTACYKCYADPTKKTQVEPTVPDTNKKSSDQIEFWICNECDTKNSKNHTACHKCKEERTGYVKLVQPAKELGDWDCTGCGEWNFKHQTVCHKCSKKTNK